MTPQPSLATTVVRSLTSADLTSASAWWAGAERREPDDAGPPANQRLTAPAGAVVLPLALVLLIGLFFGDLWRALTTSLAYMHLPVALVKMGSTAYRMVR